MFASKWLWTGIAAAFAGTACGMTLLLSARERTPELPEVTSGVESGTDILNSGTDFNQPIELNEPLESAANLPETAYLLKLEKNTLSVYREGERKPLETYELPVGWLPDYDRILLEYGMRVQGEQELRRLLEDYIS